MSNEKKLNTIPSLPRVCRNFEHYYEHTDKKGRKHYLCYNDDIVNIFFFGPQRIGPSDICQNFMYSQKQKAR